MSRWAAGVQYCGSAYAGWQHQPHAPSVQHAVESALAQVANQPISVVAAGRTDSGVHAYGQVVHFDTTAQRSAGAWLMGANVNLPDDVSLSWVQSVAANFDARRSALARRYRYVIHNHRARSALLQGRAAWVAWKLDAAAMHEAAQVLIGEHDFSSFRDSKCQSISPVRHLSHLSVRRERDLLLIDVRANAFLHHMVRTIAGTLLEVGQGRRPRQWVAEVLAARDRRAAGMNAPAQGLYFVAAEYPAEFQVPDTGDFWLGAH